MDQGHRQVEPATHPAGVRTDPAVLGVGQPDAPDQLLSAGRYLARRDAVKRRLELDQLATGHQRIEGRLLEGDADVPSDVRGLGSDVEPGDAGRPAGRAKQRDEHPHGRRLPSPVRPEEAVDLAGRDLEIDAGDRLDGALELPLEPDGLDRWRHA